MPFNSIYVANGSSLTPAVAKAIGMSSDNKNWTYIQKSQIRKISPVYIPFVQASQANSGYPFQDSANVHIELTSGEVIKFDVQSVANQSSWVTSTQRTGGTAADVESGLRQAINDMTGWL